jgi:hypothetical protein
MWSAAAMVSESKIEYPYRPAMCTARRESRPWEALAPDKRRERKPARALARKNIDALLAGNYDVILTNAAGCGSTLKMSRARRTSAQLLSNLRRATATNSLRT